MKEPEYLEGPEALEKFERGMKALFNVPKDAIVKAEKKKRKEPSSSVHKPKSSDKD